MSSKPTHTAYVVIDPKEGSEKKAQWIEVGAVCPAHHAIAETQATGARP